jgi:hypothetical protein
MAAGRFDTGTDGEAGVSAVATGKGPGSNGIHAQTSSDVDSAVYGEHEGSGIGVFGRGGPDGGEGVFGQTDTASSAVYGKSTKAGVTRSDGGEDPGGVGVTGEANLDLGIGVRGQADAFSGIGVSGFSNDGTGVMAKSFNGVAFVADGRPNGVAANIFGDVVIHGNLTVDGPIAKQGGGFQIDHPLDPNGRYLSHSFVESSDMKNIYDGVTVLGVEGTATVSLPAWFEALNEDFRYQLTCIGISAPNLHIAEELSGNRFKIAGGVRGSKVSWQVTGIRKDTWAEANRIAIESDKFYG